MPEAIRVIGSNAFVSWPGRPEFLDVRGTLAARLLAALDLNEWEVENDRVAVGSANVSLRLDSDSLYFGERYPELPGLDTLQEEARQETWLRHVTRSLESLEHEVSPFFLGGGCILVRETSDPTNLAELHLGENPLLAVHTAATVREASWNQDLDDGTTQMVRIKALSAGLAAIDDDLPFDDAEQYPNQMIVIDVKTSDYREVNRQDAPARCRELFMASISLGQEVLGEEGLS